MHLPDPTKGHLKVPLKVRSFLGAILTTAAIMSVSPVNGQPALASKEGTGAVSFSLSTLKGKRLTQLWPGQFCLIRDDGHKFVRTVVDRPEVVDISVLGKNLVALEGVGPGVAVVSFADDGDNWLALEVHVQKPAAKKAADAALLDLNKSKNKIVSASAGRSVKIRELDFKVASANAAVAVVVPKKGSWAASPSEKPDYFQIFSIQPGNVKLGKVNGSAFELKIAPTGAASQEEKYAPLISAIQTDKEAAVYLKLAQYFREQYIQTRKGGSTNIQAEVFKKYAMDCFDRAEKLDSKSPAIKERQSFLQESGK
ncbi:MAG: hypothetical protein SFV17_00150 [Candidatus Obscuribacter sp.]|nr:hypothetical protein [Candidatus Obscuribacter sp.]